MSLNERSDGFLRPSATSPPLPSLRPTLSLSFLAVRTRSKLILTFAGNWSAGRCHERASDLLRKVLY